MYTAVYVAIKLSVLCWKSITDVQINVQHIIYTQVNSIKEVSSMETKNEIISLLDSINDPKILANLLMILKEMLEYYS